MNNFENILVIGSTGMLGYAVSNYFERLGSNVKKIGRSEFDISSDPIENLSPIIENIDVVVNCAGIIKSRIASVEIEEILKVNTIFPHNLAKLCEKFNKKMFHITTDCVYSGNKGKYSEEDFFDATDVYGMSKNGGEPRNCMTLRTSIIGEEIGQGRSLLHWVLSQDGKEANGFLNHWWNGVTTVYLAEIIHKILKQDLYQKGLFHIHSPNTFNKFELVSAIAKVYEVNVNLKPVEVEVSCDRSMTSIYDITKQVATESIEEQIVRMKNFFLYK